MKNYITGKIKTNGVHGSQRIGTIIAQKDETDPRGFKVGWAICSPKDKFDKAEGETEALRKIKEGTSPPIIGKKLSRAIATADEMIRQRAHRYFKTSLDKQEADGIVAIGAELYLHSDELKDTFVLVNLRNEDYDESNVYKMVATGENQFTLTKV